jgi:large subunit ribosomal protein L17
MVTSLFKHEQLETTDAKAKELRQTAEKMITLAKRGDLHARRQALAYMKDKATTHRLFDELKDRYVDRQGGYVRIIKKTNRKGDGAPISVIQLLPEEEGKKKGKKKTKTGSAKPKAKKADKTKSTSDKPKAEKEKKAEADSAKPEAKKEKKVEAKSAKPEAKKKKKAEAKSAKPEVKKEKKAEAKSAKPEVKKEKKAETKSAKPEVKKESKSKKKGKPDQEDDG